MKKTIALFILLTACNAAPDVISRRGISSYFNGNHTGLTQTLANDMEDELFLGIQTYGYKEPLAIDATFVDWVPKAFLCNTPAVPAGTMCEGLQSSLQLTVEANPHCPWLTAYRHEILHEVLLMDTGDPDTEHAGHVWAVVNDPKITCGGVSDGSP